MKRLTKRTNGRVAVRPGMHVEGMYLGAGVSGRVVEVAKTGCFIRVNKADRAGDLPEIIGATWPEVTVAAGPQA